MQFHTSKLPQITEIELKHEYDCLITFCRHIIEGTLYYRSDFYNKLNGWSSAIITMTTANNLSHLRGSSWGFLRFYKYFVSGRLQLCRGWVSWV